MRSVGEWPNAKRQQGKPYEREHLCFQCDMWMKFDIIVGFIAANGTKIIRQACSVCEHTSSVSLPVKDVNFDEIRIVHDGRIHKCERCGTIGAELHHWAPSYKFEDSYSWPSSYLCCKCHREWHTTMDPNIFKRNK